MRANPFVNFGRMALDESERSLSDPLRERARPSSLRDRGNLVHLDRNKLNGYLAIQARRDVDLSGKLK